MVVTVNVGRHDRQVGEDEVDAVPAHVLVAPGVEVVPVKARQGIDHNREHTHGVGILGHGVEETLEAFFQPHVDLEVGLEVLKLGPGGQLAAQQQVHQLGEGGLIGELLDGVAPVLQDTLDPIDEGDGTLGGTRVLEAGVEGDVLRLAEQLRDIYAFFIISAGNDRE